MNLKPYPSYKDSGVEWIGEIPEGWEVKRLKFLFNSMDYKRVPLSAEMRSDIEKIYPYYGASGIIDFVDNYLFDEPLLLVAEDGANLLSRSTPLAFIANGKYWVNNHAHILKPLAGPLIYWEGVMQSYDYTPIISGSAQPKLTAENLREIPLPTPQKEEMETISAFLDHHTDRIDTLISKNRRLIDLLKEKRAALINHTVTKGLDPDAKMKDSGVEWIGEIPEEWEVHKLKRLLLPGNNGMKMGPFGSQLKLEIMAKRGNKVYGQENVINNNFKLGERFIDEEKFKELRVYEIFPGDIVISTMGTVGNCRIVPVNIDRGIMDSHLIRMRVNSLIINQFFSLILNDSSYLFYNLIKSSKGSIMTGLNSEIISNLLLVLPPLEIQEEILRYLNRKTALIDKEISLVKKKIKLLEEYRKSLIHHVVTGKVDVRGVEA